MKWILLSIAMCLSLSCATHDFEKSKANAQAVGLKAAAEVADQDSAIYEVRVDSNDDGERHYRAGQLVLSRSMSAANVYRLLSPTLTVARVLINKSNSPRIYMSKNLPLSVFIEYPADNTLQLTVYDARSGFLEVYEITPDSVKPVDAERFRGFAIEAAASRKYFNAIAESLTDDSKRNAP